jgi:hypothetical protein
MLKVLCVCVCVCVCVYVNAYLWDVEREDLPDFVHHHFVHGACLCVCVCVCVCVCMYVCM